MNLSSTPIRHGALALLLVAAASGCSPASTEDAGVLGPSPLIAEAVEPADNDAAEDEATATADTEIADAEVLGTTEESAAEETPTDESTEDAANSEEAIEAERPAGNYAIVSVPVGLNMRSGPGVENDVVLAVEKDRIVTATGQESGGWLEVQLDGLTGWMSADYLQATNNVDSPSAAQDENIYVESRETGTAPATTGTPAGIRDLIVANVAEGVNLRQGPSTETDIVIGAPVNSIVTATGRTTGEWVEVTLDGFTGWTLSQYLIAV